MTVYLCAFALACLFMALAGMMRSRVLAMGRHSDVRATMLVFLAAAPIVLLVGLRSVEVGPDTYTYVVHYFEVGAGRSGALDMNFSPLYWLFVKASYAICGSNWTGFLLIEGALVCLFLFLALWRTCRVPWLGLLVFVCFGFAFEFVNQYRQFLACAILLYAFPDYAEGRVVRYALWVLAASGIHPAALVMLAAIPLRGVELDMRVVAASLVGMLLIGANFGAIESLVSRIPYFGAYVGSVYDYEISANTVFNFLFRAGLFLFLYYKRGPIVELSPGMKYAYPILLLGVLLQSAAVSSTAFGRLPTFAICHFALLVPAAYQAFKPGSLLRYAIVLVLCALFMANLALKDYGSYRYETVFDSNLRIAERDGRWS